MDHIKQVVADVIGKISSGNRSVQNIQSAWKRISGDERTKVVSFKDGCLSIGADSSMRLVRLNLNREKLLKELQREFPEIIKIIFKVGI